LAVTRVDELLAAIAGTDSGASATPDDRRRVLSLAAELEAEYAKTGVRAALKHALMRWSGCV
jgi:sulfite reductase beta subunit-like hemoprotein